MKFPELSPERRSAMVAIIAGMMAAAYLHGEGTVDLSFGFPPGGLIEGAILAIFGSLGGYAVLLTFRTLRDFATRGKK